VEISLKGKSLSVNTNVSVIIFEKGKSLFSNFPFNLMEPVYVVSSCRTPIGTFQGSLSGLTAVDLGSICVKGKIKVTP
jgi:hypothetical protein